MVRPMAQWEVIPWLVGMDSGTSHPSALTNGSLGLRHVSTLHKPCSETTGIPCLGPTGAVGGSPETVVRGGAGLSLPPSSPKICSHETDACLSPHRSPDEVW